MPIDEDMWADAVSIEGLCDVGTDLYWVNQDRDTNEMTPLVRQLASLTRGHGKQHHQWLQCWGVQQGREPRILEQGRILIREKPDALYVWAYKGQVGTAETCDAPAEAWAAACQVLKEAKGLS